MPQKVLKFNGINRRSNEYSGPGACEELVNLRPTVFGLEVVKNKAKKFQNIDYNIYCHTFGSKTLFIGVSLVPSGRAFSIVLVDEEGNATEIDTVAAYNKDYDISFLGNKVIFYHSGTQHVYAYKEDKYIKVSAAVPDDLKITFEYNRSYDYTNEVSITDSNIKSKEFQTVMQEQWSAAQGQAKHDNATFGQVLIAVNYTLSDGTEFWTNKWIYVNPFLFLPLGDDGEKLLYYEKGGSKTFNFMSFTVNATVHSKAFAAEGVENMVKEVNIYASRPVFPYDIENLYTKNAADYDKAVYSKTIGMKNSDLPNQLLYLQKTIPVSQIESGDVTFALNFRESQAGEKVLEVDNGPVERTGRTAIFNNRVHLYDSKSRIYPQQVVCTSDDGYDLMEPDPSELERTAYVYLESNGETIVIQTTAYVPALTNAEFVNKIYCCYPDARAKKVLIKYLSSSSKFFTINLEPSPRYNYAYGEASDHNELVNLSDIKVTSPFIAEPNAINVSEQDNPFVFDVKYSYSVGGEVMDIATSYLPISSTQIGQYPLTVFTSNGIYALEQGSGTLYGNVVPLQPHVIQGKAVPTPYGTFFVSSKSLYVLAGREASNVSYVLDGRIEQGIKETHSFKALCCSGNGPLYDFSACISAMDFEEFIDNAFLTYDQFRNELIISSSNESAGYSYVFNLDTKAYHKIGKRYLRSQSGTRYATEADGGIKNMVDLHTEVASDQNILLQSRPFSLEEFYTHIQRLVMYADAKLEGTQNLCLSVFASDNLNDWKCIISAQKANTVFRQVRTNKAAKSYRDYVVLINGTVSTSTDISDIISDYTVMQRRLG